MPKTTDDSLVSVKFHSLPPSSSRHFVSFPFAMAPNANFNHKNINSGFMNKMNSRLNARSDVFERCVCAVFAVPKLRVPIYLKTLRAPTGSQFITTHHADAMGVMSCAMKIAYVITVEAAS